MKLEQLQEALADWYNMEQGGMVMGNFLNKHSPTLKQVLEQTIEIAKGEAWVMRFKPIDEAECLKELKPSSYRDNQEPMFESNNLLVGGGGEPTQIDTLIRTPTKTIAYIYKSKVTHFATFNNNNGEIPIPNEEANANSN